MVESKLSIIGFGDEKRLDKLKTDFLLIKTINTSVFKEFLFLFFIVASIQL
jgi:hypothetical protein